MAPNTYEIGLLLFIKLETHDPNISPSKSPSDEIKWSKYMSKKYYIGQKQQLNKVN